MPDHSPVLPVIDWAAVDTMRFIAMRLSREFNYEHPLAVEGRKLAELAESVAGSLGERPPVPVPVPAIALVR